MRLSQKLEMLSGYLSREDGIAVAFSGGTDSVFLLAAALRYSLKKILAVTVKTPYIPQSVITDAAESAGLLGACHVIINLPHIPEEIMNNPPDRCYLCKRKIMEAVTGEAGRRGIHLVTDGSNADDLLDYRPGFRALKEAGVKSPLLECGFTKGEIRAVSRKWNLPSWNKNPTTCLLTRMDYDKRIEKPVLGMIEKAEEYIAGKGFSSVRVRTSVCGGKKCAVIEVSKNELGKINSGDIYPDIRSRLLESGYDKIMINREGYKTGSMNEFLKGEKRV